MSHSAGQNDAARPLSRRAPRAFNVDSAGGHVFQGLSRRAESIRGDSEYDALIVILSGTYHARWRDDSGDRRLSATDGDVVYRAGSARLVESNDPAPRLTAVVLYFRWSNRSLSAPQKVVDRHGLIRVLADAMLSIQDSPSPRRRSIENGYLAAALAEYHRIALSEDDDLAGRLRRFVYENIRGRIAIAELARYLQMNPRRLQRKFKAMTGRTPMQEVRRIRVEVAVRLLIGRSKRTLKDAAMRVGVKNEQELCRMIRKHTGLTAGQLRGGQRRDI